MTTTEERTFEQLSAESLADLTLVDRIISLAWDVRAQRPDARRALLLEIANRFDATIHRHFYALVAPPDSPHVDPCKCGEAYPGGNDCPTGCPYCEEANKS